MDQLTLLLAASVAAFALGTVVADWRSRRLALLKIAASEADLRKTTAEIAVTHNSLAQQLLAMQDQINGHELRMSGQPTKASTLWASQQHRPTS